MNTLFNLFTCQMYLTNMLSFSHKLQQCIEHGISYIGENKNWQKFQDVVAELPVGWGEMNLSHQYLSLAPSYLQAQSKELFLFGPSLERGTGCALPYLPTWILRSSEDFFWLSLLNMPPQFPRRKAPLQLEECSSQKYVLGICLG